MSDKSNTAPYDAELQLRLLCHPNAVTLGERDRLDRMCRAARVVVNELDRLREREKIILDALVVCDGGQYINDVLGRIEWLKRKVGKNG